MSGKPKFLFGGEGGTYEDFERKLLSEISKAGLSTEFKKKSFLYKHLTGTVLNTLTKLLFPIKISDKSFDELLISLKIHYIPNRHLRERVLLYARIQEEEEQTKDFFETLKSIASRCLYKDDELKLVLCDKVLTGIRCPRLRESLFVAGIKPSCTAEQYMEYALLYEININNERLAREKKIDEKTKKLNINKNLDRSPSPNHKKSKSDSPAAKFGVSLKKGIENNNINLRNGNKGKVVWEPKVPLTPQSTFGVTLKSKSTSQVSPKSPPVLLADIHKENQFPELKPLSNGTQDNLNGMPSPKPMTIPEIMEFVKEPRKPAFTPETKKIFGNKGFVPKPAQQREPSWSRSPSPEPRKPAASTPESKHMLDKNNQNRKTTKPSLRRESSWSPSPSPEPGDMKIQGARGRSFAKDPAPKMKRSSSTLSVRGTPFINDLSTINIKTPPPKLKRSSSSVSLSRNPLPELQESFDPMRSLRQGLAALKSVKHLKPEQETINKKERFDISDKLPKLRSVGGFNKSPSEMIELMPDIPEIIDFEPRKPTITPEARRILDKYLNKPPPKLESPKRLPREERSYSPSPEPEPRPDLTRKPLFNRCSKPSTTLPNKSMSYSDLTKSNLFDQFLQAKNTQMTQKPVKVNRPAKKDEVPQLTDEVRRKLEEKYGIIKGKPKEPISEETLQPEIDKSPSRTQQSRDIFKEKTNATMFGVVKPSDRVVQMYKESQQVKEALKEAAFPTHPEKAIVYLPTTHTGKPYNHTTIKASPKIAEMYKAQIIERDKTKCPSPPPEKVTSSITRFADKKWVSTLDLSSSKKEYDADSHRTPKPSLRREASWSPSVSPEPQDNRCQLNKENPKPSLRREPSWSPSVSPEPQDKRDQSKNETPKPSLRREPSWSPSVSPEPQDNKGQLKTDTPKPSIRREPSWSPSVSPEPQDNRGQLKKDTPKPSLRREPSWSPSVSPEPQDNKGQLKKDNPKPSQRRESSWSPSPSPEPQDNLTECKKETSKLPQRRQSLPIRREPSWSPSPSPEPRDTRCQDDRGRSSAREPSSQLKRSCSNLNARDKPSTNTKATVPTLKRSCSVISISRNSRILNEIPEIPENIEPIKSTITSETQKILNKYCNEREPSYSPSPEPEPRSDLTREQLFDKYAKPSTKYQAKSSSYLDLTKSEIFDQFLQARDSPTTLSKVKMQIKVNKSAKKDEVPQLTDDDRRKLEEKYGIIRGKPKEPKTEESPEPKRKKSPSRAQLSRKLFEEKEKALKIGVVKDTDKDEQRRNSLPSNPEMSNGITPTTPNEKPTIIIKTSTNIAEKYKAELEKLNQKSCQSPLTEKAASTIARSSEKRGSLDLTPLELSRMKKEYDAESLRKESLKYNVKECKYNAEVDYGDSLLKVSEKDAFTVRTMKTEFSPQDRTDSPGSSVIPPKPGSAAAAKPQFDISSFFDGSSYSNFMESAKSTKGGTK